MVEEIIKNNLFYKNEEEVVVVFVCVHIVLER